MILSGTNSKLTSTDFIVISYKEFIQKLKGEFKLICLRATILNLIEKTNLKTIDPETLKITKLSTEEDTFFVELPLDRVPQEDWQELFEKELKKTAQPLALTEKSNDSYPIGEPNYANSLQGDTISIITTPKKLQEDIELVIQLVKTVNNRVDQHNKEVNEQNEKEKSKTKNDEETICEMRESLKKNPPTQ